MTGGRGDRRLTGGGVVGGLPRGGEVPDQEIGDGPGLLHRYEVRGARYDGEPRVRDAGDQRTGLRGASDLVVGADEDKGRHPDTGEFGPDVERGEGLAGGDVAAGVGGTDHLHGPVGDRGLRGGEPAGEPAVRGGTGDGVEAVRPDDHAPLPELVRRPEPGRGGDQGERGDPLRMPQRQLQADRAAERTARVAETLHTETVEGGEQPVGDGTDRTGRVGGRAAVARQVEPEDPPLLGQLGDLPVPHVPGGAERGPQDEDRGVVRAVEAVLEGGGLRLTHRSTLTAVSEGPAPGPPVPTPGSRTSTANPHRAFTEGRATGNRAPGQGPGRGRARRSGCACAAVPTARRRSPTPGRRAASRAARRAGPGPACRCR